MIEAQIRYILQAVERLAESPALDVRPGVLRRFNDQLQADFKGTSWTGGCTSWYIRDGRVINNWVGFRGGVQGAHRPARSGGFRGDRLIRLSHRLATAGARRIRPGRRIHRFRGKPLSNPAARAPVDRQRDAGHESGFIGCEIEGRVRDVPRRPHLSPERHPRIALRRDLFPREGSMHGPGCRPPLVCPSPRAG